MLRLSKPWIKKVLIVVIVVVAVRVVTAAEVLLRVEALVVVSVAYERSKTQL